MTTHGGPNPASPRGRPKLEGQSRASVSTKEAQASGPRAARSPAAIDALSVPAKGRVIDAWIVPGHPHILLAAGQSAAWGALRATYDRVRTAIAASGADLIVLYSTQWFSVIGHQFQADPEPRWVHVDENWYDLGDMPYTLRIDEGFAHAYCAQATRLGLHARTVRYRGFPIDTASIVALSLIDPERTIPAAIVSCNIYAGKRKSILLGKAGRRTIEASGRKAVAVAVTSLSNRYHTHDVDPAEDRISSAKDDEWNRKILSLIAAGRLEDLVQVARPFAREANADMGFKAIWWLAGMLRRRNDFTGQVLDYQPVWGTGAAVARLTPPSEPSSEDFEEDA